MIGAQESNGRCPSCGGRLSVGIATIPYIFSDAVVLVKGVPAQICASCREPFTTGAITDRITELLHRVKDLHTEVTVVPFQELEKAVA